MGLVFSTRSSTAAAASRLLTTTYTGASDALAALARWGAEVWISFDNRRIRLHAKSWIFHRRTGATTAYVGSSNLSSSVMLEGLEWNVRLAALESPGLLRAFDPEDDEQMLRWTRPGAGAVPTRSCRSST